MFDSVNYHASDGGAAAEDRRIRVARVAGKRCRASAPYSGQLRRAHIERSSASGRTTHTRHRRGFQIVPPRARCTEAQSGGAIYVAFPVLPPARSTRYSTDRDARLIRVRDGNLRDQGKPADAGACEKEK